MKRVLRRVLGGVGGLLVLVGIGVTGHSAQAATTGAQISGVTEKTPLYLAPAARSAATDLDTLNWHYSHQSHGSHYSHGSHESHYSHYSSRY